jgi:hypothetical protein
MLMPPQTVVYYDRPMRAMHHSLPMSRPPEVLLVTPLVYDFAYFDLFSKPYGLLRVGRWLEEAGYRVTHVDALTLDDRESIRLLGSPKRKGDGTGHVFRAPAPWPDGVPPVPRRFSRYGIVASSFERRIRDACADGSTAPTGQRRPDLVLVGTGMTYWYPGVREAVAAVRRYAPGVPIVAGGVYATLQGDHCLEACGVDHVVRGDVRPEFCDLLARFGLPVPEGSPSGRVLDDPTWRDAGVVRLHAGCPYRCDYCASGAIHDRFTEGSVDDAFDAIREIASRGARDVAFYDDALLYPSAGIEGGPGGGAGGSRFERLLERIIEFGIDLRFHAPNGLHLRYLDRALAKLMRNAGFVEARLGFESSSAQFHARHGSKYHRESPSSAIEALRDARFLPEEITLYVLAGLPGQHPGEVEESIHAAARFGTRVEITEFSPVPGSSLWERCVRESRYPIAEEPLYQNNTLLPMRSDRFGPEELQALKLLARAHNRTLAST